MENKNNIFTNELNNGLNAQLNQDVPNNYFESFEPSLMDKIRLEDFLENLPKQNVYTVPVNYFESFGVNKIKLKVETNQKIKLSFKKVLYIAAGLALIIATSVYVLKPNTLDNHSQQFASIEQLSEQITEQDAEEFVTENIDEFSTQIETNIQQDSTISLASILPLEVSETSVDIDDIEDFL